MLQEIEMKLRELIRKDESIGDAIDNLNPEDNLEVIGFNSMNFIKLVVELESQFQLSFGEKEMKSENFKTLRSMAVVIDNKLSNTRNWADYRKRFEAFLQEEQRKNPDVSFPGLAETKVADFREVYLNHSATTFIRLEVKAILDGYYQGNYGFALPGYRTLQESEAHRAVAESRRMIADCFQVTPEEIVFTGSGDEASNLAIKGLAFQHFEAKGHLITTKGEKLSVLRAMEFLEKLGFTVTYLDVSREGLVTAEEVEKAMRTETILVFLSAVNPETGAINPIAEIGKVCKEHGVPLLVDAANALGRIPLNPKESGISLLSFSGHTLYGPKGVGGLYVAEEVKLVPLIHGNGEEGLAETENVGSILALGEAVTRACAEMEAETRRLKELREYFIDELEIMETDMVILQAAGKQAAHILLVGFGGVDGLELGRSLNYVGISVSLGSDHLLAALGADTGKYAFLRFSFGLGITRDDLRYVLDKLGRALYKGKCEE